MLYMAGRSLGNFLQKKISLTVYTGFMETLCKHFLPGLWDKSRQVFEVNPPTLMLVTSVGYVYILSHMTSE